MIIIAAYTKKLNFFKLISFS